MCNGIHELHKRIYPLIPILAMELPPIPKKQDYYEYVVKTCEDFYVFKILKIN